MAASVVDLLASCTEALPCNIVLVYNRQEYRVPSFAGGVLIPWSHLAVHLAVCIWRYVSCGMYLAACIHTCTQTSAIFCGTASRVVDRQERFQVARLLLVYAGCILTPESPVPSSATGEYSSGGQAMLTFYHADVWRVHVYLFSLLPVVYAVCVGTASPPVRGRYARGSGSGVGGKGSHTNAEVPTDTVLGLHRKVERP